jgi:hypothetical protein
MGPAQKYFKRQGTQVLFIGKKLEILIPKRYAKDGYLVESDIVSTIGVFDMIIDGEKYIYNAPIFLSIKPSSSETVVEGGNEYLKLYLTTNDIFIVDTEVVKNATIPYILFIEFINLAHYPLFSTYEILPSLFDNMGELSGLNFNTDRSILELFSTYLARDIAKTNTLYKDTNMEQPPRMVAMRDIAHSAITTTSKIAGSFMAPGINSALSEESTITSDVEQHLRK